MSNARETIERLRRKLNRHMAGGTLPDYCVQAPVEVATVRVLLDIAEAAERLRALDAQWWAVREQGSVSWCCLGCGEAAPHGDPHAPDCPAIALDRALDALGGE